MTPQTVAIVGNGPVAKGAAAAIDASDRVIRFNRPAHSPGEAGEKTDFLFFANSGKGTQRILTDPAFPGHAAVKACRQVMLPYHPTVISRFHPKPNILSRLRGRRADWTDKAIRVFGAAGKEVTIFSPQFYEACCAELEIAPGDQGRVFPSTGFIAIRWVLQEIPQARMQLFGFGWTGWKRHDWERERHWVEKNVPLETLQDVSRV